MVNPTTAIIRQLKRSAAPSTPVATNMHLPNHSGDHDAGKVRKAPVNDMDIANKKYVDDSVAAAGGGNVEDGTAAGQMVDAKIRRRLAGMQ